MGQSLRELLIDVKVRVDKSGLAGIDRAAVQATESAGVLERMLLKVAAASKKIDASRASAQAGFEKVTGLSFSKRVVAPRKGQSLAAPNIEDFTVKPKTALESLKERFQTTFSAAGTKIKAASDKVDEFAGKLFNARTAFAGFAAVIVARGIGEFIGDVVEAGRSLAEMSARTHVSVESLQGWRALIAKAGIDTSTLETGFRKLAKAARASEKATSPQAKAFKDLGVETQNAAKTGLRPIEDIMVDVGSALADMTDETTASAIATQLLGPAGNLLVPAFEAGGDAVRKFLEVQRENVSITTEDAKRLKEVGEAVERGGKKWTGLKNLLVGAMLPVLEWVAQKFDKVSKWLFNTAKHTKIFQTVLGMLATGGLWKVGMMLASWVSKAGGVKVVLGMLRSGLMSAARSAFWFIGPMLLIEDFLVFLAGGKSIFGRAMNEIFGDGGAQKARQKFLDFFVRLKEIAGEVGTALGALASNDIFTGIAKGALDAIVATLNLLGIALSNDADQAERMKKAFLGATAPKPNSVFSKVPEFSQKIGNKVFGDIEDKTSWFQRFRKGAQNLFTPERDVVHNRIAKAMLPDGINGPGVVPPPMVPGGGQPGKNITWNDQRSINIDVSGSSNPGTTARAVSEAVSSNLEIDSRQTLSAVSE